MAIRLSVQPMAAPKPVLKVQLLPEMRELNVGNPAHEYDRCFAEQRNFFFSKEAVADRGRYLSMPLGELPVQKLRDYGRLALSRADWAARLNHLDWQLLQQTQTHATEVTQPEVGRLAVLAEALRVRFRVEIASGRFDDAIGTAKTMFALARHLGEYPTQAGNLIGLAVAHLCMDSLEEMVQQPGCPNFYWALTDLPIPLVEVRKGVRGDCASVAADLRLLREDAPMDGEHLEQFLQQLSGLLGFARAQKGLPPRNLRSALAARVQDSELVRAARARLVEAGYAEKSVKQFPPLQAILLADKRDYEVHRDESLKLLALAPWQIDAFADTEGLHCGDGVFAPYSPRVIEVRRAQGRLEQRIGLLQHIEALRLYAAAHAGELPTELSELSVPLVLDPFTGKPFRYNVEAGTAYLSGRPPRGEEQNPCFHLHYALTLRK
ncbi:MAG TPA: hypothetical protein VKU02_24315 [Gemmataceae bacterium]|nr:hypothetical protein [Gemmataceae bacterium]